MYGFEPKEAKELGAHGRYYARIEKFKKKGKKFPRTQHYVHWVFHNLVVHPLIGFFPGRKWAGRFHDWHSRKLNAD